MVYINHVFSQGWKNNVLVRVIQNLTTILWACWLPDWSSNRCMVHPVFNTSEIPKGNQFLISKGQTTMHLVRIARFSQNDHEASWCITVPPITVLKEVFFKGGKTDMYSPIRYHMKPPLKREQLPMCKWQSLSFQLWTISIARFRWAERLDGMSCSLVNWVSWRSEEDSTFCLCG